MHIHNSLGVNNLWKEALLNASRNLRQNVLKGRIWGFADEDDKEIITSTPFRHSLYYSSTSSIEDSFGSQDTTPSKSNGRVRGLVASLERTCSSDSEPSHHGSSTSEGDSMPGTWADDEAVFTSGSEASDVEDRKARATTIKRLVAEPVQAKILPEIEDEAHSPESEPTVEELLAQETLSSSFGARAWEEADMKMGETVKRIVAEDENAGTDPSLEHASTSSNSSGSRRDSAKDYAKASTKLQIKDIFSRPLPSRPLPTPPKSGTSSPVLQTPITRIPVRLVEKMNKSVQVENVSEDAPDHHGADAELIKQESEKLESTLSLLEQFQARLAEVERKLKDLEHKDDERMRVTGATSMNPNATSALESKTMQAEISTHEFNPATTIDKPVALVTSPPLPPSSTSEIEAPTKDDEPKVIISRRITNMNWRGYMPRKDWDPLDNGIPHYVLMVGVGVCAVVFTAFLKRLAGRKA